MRIQSQISANTGDAVRQAIAEQAFRLEGLLGILGGAGGALNVKDFLSLGQVAIFATIVSVVNVILLTALSVLATLLYNIAAALVGGIGLTLTDD